MNSALYGWRQQFIYLSQNSDANLCRQRANCLSANATGYARVSRLLRCLWPCVGSRYDNGRSRVWGLRIPSYYKADSEWSIRLYCCHDKTIKLNNSIDLCREFNGIMLLFEWFFQKIRQISFVTQRFHSSCSYMKINSCCPVTSGHLKQHGYVFQLNSRTHHDVIYYRHYRSMRS